MTNLYKATPTKQYRDQKDTPPVVFGAEDDKAAKTHIINHCDLSYMWDFEEINQEPIKIALLGEE